MSSEDVLGQVARDVSRLQSRVHMLESITRPQAKARITEVLRRDVSIAVVLWLPKSDSQKDLAKLVSKSIGRRVEQVTMSRELRRLRSHGVLGRTRARGYYVEQAWIDAGLDTDLRRLAKKMGLKVAPRRRVSR